MTTNPQKKPAPSDAGCMAVVLVVVGIPMLLGAVFLLGLLVKMVRWAWAG